MNEQTLSLVANIVIVLLCTWAVLTHKVRTNSLDILALGLVCVSATLGVGDFFSHVMTTPSATMMRTGIAGAGLFYFMRVEIVPRILLELKK